MTLKNNLTGTILCIVFGAIAGYAQTCQQACGAAEAHCLQYANTQTKPYCVQQYNACIARCNASAQASVLVRPKGLLSTVAYAPPAPSVSSAETSSVEYTDSAILGAANSVSLSSKKDSKTTVSAGSHTPDAADLPH
jgi:hypothetical protein